MIRVQNSKFTTLVIAAALGLIELNTNAIATELSEVTHFGKLEVEASWVRARKKPERIAREELNIRFNTKSKQCEIVEKNVRFECRYVQDRNLVRDDGKLLVFQLSETLLSAAAQLELVAYTVQKSEEQKFQAMAFLRETKASEISLPWHVYDEDQDFTFNVFHGFSQKEITLSALGRQMIVTFTLKKLEARKGAFNYYGFDSAPRGAL